MEGINSLCHGIASHWESLSPRTKKGILIVAALVVIVAASVIALILTHGSLLFHIGGAIAHLVHSQSHLHLAAQIVANSIYILFTLYSCAYFFDQLSKKIRPKEHKHHHHHELLTLTDTYKGRTTGHHNYHAEMPIHVHQDPIL